MLLIPTAVACSNAEPPPFFAEGAAAQRRCARSLNDQDIASVHAGVDGGALVRLDAGRQFRVTTPQVATTSVADNAFGAEPGPTTFVGDGWLAEIKGLSAGEHTLRFEVELTTGDLLSDEMVVVVVAEGD